MNTLVLDRSPDLDWSPLVPTIAVRPEDVRGPYAAVAWGDPPFVARPELLRSLGAPRVVSSREEVVAAARALGLAAHRIPRLRPEVVARALRDDTGLVAVPVGTVDLGTGEVWATRPVRLTDLERRLLLFLAERPGETVDRDTLHDEVFGYRDTVVTRAVDTAITRLRRKLGPACLVTAYGRGYRFVPVLHAAAPPTPTPPPARRLVFGATVVDLDRRRVVRQGVEHALTEQNATLLVLLWAAAPRSVDHRTLSRELSLRGVAVRHAVRRLRHKLEDDPLDPRILVAVPGGYRLDLGPGLVPVGVPASQRHGVVARRLDADRFATDLDNVRQAWVTLQETNPEGVASLRDALGALLAHAAAPAPRVRVRAESVRGELRAIERILSVLVSADRSGPVGPSVG